MEKKNMITIGFLVAISLLFICIIYYISSEIKERKKNEKLSKDYDYLLNRLVQIISIMKLKEQIKEDLKEELKQEKK